MDSTVAELDDYKLNTYVCQETNQVVHPTGYDVHLPPELLQYGTEQRWQRIREVGRGAFGKVWLEEQLSQELVGPQCRAVKTLAKSTIERNQIDFKRELLTLLKFSRRKFHLTGTFVEFYGWFEDADQVSIAMEYFPHGVLTQYVSKGLSERSARQIAFQLLQGLQNMHSEGYAHRDLKPDNIFVFRTAPQWRVKIGDFGISKCVSSEVTALRTTIGTPRYLAPEVSLYVDHSDSENSSHSSVYTDAVDIWSLGCVVYEILTARRPFPNYPRDLLDFCDRRKMFPEQPLMEKHISQEGSRFVKSLLTPRPRSRPSAHVAATMDWFTAKLANQSNLHSPAEATPDVKLSNDSRSREEPLLKTSNNKALSKEGILGVKKNQGKPISKSIHESIDDNISVTGTELYLMHTLPQKAKHYNVSTKLDPSVGGLDHTLTKLDLTGSSATIPEIESSNTSSMGVTTVSSDSKERSTVEKKEFYEGVDDTSLQDTLWQLFENLSRIYPPEKENKIATTNLTLSEADKMQLEASELYKKCKVNGREKDGANDEAKRAESLCRQAYATRKALLGNNHTYTLESLHTIGYGLWVQQRHRSAAPILLDAARRRAAVLGQKHKDLWWSMHFLGISLYLYKDYMNAVKILRETVTGWRKTLGAKDKNTLLTLHWLGRSLQVQYRHAAALQVFKETVELREKTLGRWAEETLISKRCQGDCQLALKDFATAAETFELVFDGECNRYGADDERPLQTLFNLGLCKYHLHEYQDAMLILVDLAHRREIISGEYHIDTVKCQYWLGRTGYALCEYTFAKKQFQKCLVKHQEILGSDHKVTLNSMEWLARVLYQLNEFYRAEEVSLDVCRTRKKVLEKDHPDTISALEFWGQCNYSLQVYRIAMTIFEEVVAVRERTLGVDHEVTKMSRWWLEKSTDALIMSQSGSSSRREV